MLTIGKDKTGRERFPIFQSPAVAQQLPRKVIFYRHDTLVQSSLNQSQQLKNILLILRTH